MFDPVLLHKQYHECLLRLLRLYSLNEVPAAEREEFDMYYMLTYLGNYNFKQTLGKFCILLLF